MQVRKSQSARDLCRLDGYIRLGIKPFKGSIAFRQPLLPTRSDEKGFCASVPIQRVAELDYVLMPGRYVGLPDDEDDFDFAERFAALKAELEAS